MFKMRNIILIIGCLLAALCITVDLDSAKKNKKKKPRKKKELIPASAEDVVKVTDEFKKLTAIKPAKSRKVLVFYLCEGFLHQAISIGNKALEIMGDKTGAFKADFSKDYSVFDWDNLKQYDGIILNNTTKLKFDDANKKAIIEFVKKGKAMIGIHAASDNFYDWPEGAEMMGGLFDKHPWGGGGTWAVKLDEPGHPLNKAFKGKGFEIKDELYQFKAPYSRRRSRILTSVDMSKEQNLEMDEKHKAMMKRTDNDFAISWIHRYGKGRVFFCGFGHNNEVFWNKAVMQHLLDGIQYALGDHKVDDTPSHP